MMNDKSGKTQVKLTKNIHVQSKLMIDLETNKWKDCVFVNTCDLILSYLAGA